MSPALTARPLRAVVFDFDGVILDSAGIKTEAFPALFADDRPEFAEEILQHHLAHQGISRYEKFRWIYRNLFQEPLSEDQCNALGDRFSDLVYERVVAAEFIPGAPELLRTLREQGILSFVASGTPQSELQRITHARELDPYFERVEGSPRSKVEIVHGIMQSHGLSSDEMIFVGDAVTDYEAARATDLSFVAVDTPEMTEFWRREGVVLYPDLFPLLRAVGRGKHSTI